MLSNEIIDEIKSREDNANLSSTRLLQLLNLTYLEKCAKIRKTCSDYFLTSYEIVGDGSTLEFTLPKNFRTARKMIDSSGNPFNPADIGRDGGWFLLGGFESDTHEYRQKICFKTAPGETYTLYYEFSPDALDLTTTTVPLIPEEYHEVLIIGPLKKLHSLDDDTSIYKSLDAEDKRLTDDLVMDIAERIDSGEMQVEVNDDDLE